jgi:hypothetical protein
MSPTPANAATAVAEVVSPALQVIHAELAAPFLLLSPEQAVAILEPQLKIELVEACGLSDAQVETVFATLPRASLADRRDALLTVATSSAVLFARRQMLVDAYHSLLTSGATT